MKTRKRIKRYGCSPYYKYGLLYFLEGKSPDCQYNQFWRSARLSLPEVFEEGPAVSLRWD